MHRKPLLEVIGPGGFNLLPGLGGLWKSVSTSDKAGQDSDSATIVCVGPPSFLALPKRGDVYQILMGWADEGLVLIGRYSFQKARASGSPTRGDEIELQFRAADFVQDLKKGGRKHYDDMTYGKLIKQLAGEAGLSAEVAPELDGIKLGYRLRFDQSLIDFATELSEEVGATVKPSGGKLVATKKGSGKAAGGRALEPILIRRDRCLSYEVEIDPRPEVGKVAAAWQDEKSGKRKLVKAPAGREGPVRMLPHPFKSEGEAKAAAEADAYECVNRSGTGSFECPGLPRARAEAPATVIGFGPMLDGPWRAEGVEHSVTKGGGFTTTVSVTAGKNKKGEKGK